METKFIELDSTVCRLTHVPSLHATLKEDVVMLLFNPSVSLETEECGIGYAPPESIELWGIDNLLKLSDEIRDYCEAVQALEKEKK